MPGCALGQCRSWEPGTGYGIGLESRLFLTEKESTNMQKLQINTLFSTISLSVGSFRLIFN